MTTALRQAGEPGGPDDRYCSNCGHSKNLFDSRIRDHGFDEQECWVEEPGEDRMVAVRLRHRWAA